MPQVWLSKLKQSRPLLAETLEGKCAQIIADVTLKEPAYVLNVAHGVITDKNISALFWGCIEYWKEKYEKRTGGKSN